jgi:tetracycline resistance efflux pump
MQNAWLSILPPVITIAFAVWSKKILPSLLLGLLVGSYILNPSLLGGVETAIENIIKILSDKDNLHVLLFLYLFSGLISLLRKADGISAFSTLAGKHIKSKKGVFYILWALIPITFIDCAFRIIGAGSIVSSLAEKTKIAKERLAFMLNNTASPVVELIPIATTFVGFNIANIGQGLKVAGVKNQSAYSTLLHAIPFEFFSIVILIITFLSIYFQLKKPSAEKGIQNKKMEMSDGMNMDMKDEKPEIKPRLFNLIIPMVVVIILSFFFFWYFGKDKGGVDSNISSVIAATDPNKAMLVALFISMMITGVIYFFQKYSLKKMTADVISGGNELMNILAILIVAWALSSVTQDLHLSDFIKQQLSGLPAWSIPVSLFIVASVVTYFIGEGWAASSLIMPFAISLAVTASTGIPLCVAAVITGGTFGDVTSPVAGMTNMSSNIAGADHTKYLKYASPYNFIAAGIASVLFLIAGIF